MESKLEARGDYLSLECRGGFDIAAARAIIVDIVAQANAQGVDRVFADLRGVTTTVGIGERYDLAALLARAGAAGLRVAVLVEPHNAFTKTFENTATNRGLAVRTTTSLAEARAFLGLKDS